MDKRTIIIIKWRDASYVKGPMPLDEIKPLIDLLTIGWLVTESAEAVTMCAEIGVEDEEFSHIIHIPKVNILSRMELPWDPDQAGFSGKRKRLGRKRHHGRSG